MNRIVVFVTALALGCLGLLVPAVPAAPAAAATYPSDGVSLTTNSISVWPDGCGTVRYSVSGPFKNYDDWGLWVTIADPHGNEWEENYFNQTDTNTSGGISLCPFMDTPGRYRVTVLYKTYETDGTTVIEQGGVTGYFTLTRRAKQASRLTVTKTRKGAHSWKMVGRLTKAGKPWGGHRVQIQAYGRAWGGWAVLKAKATNRMGRVVFTSTPKRGAAKYPLRLHSAGGRFVRDADSRSFRVRHR